MKRPHEAIARFTAPKDSWQEKRDGDAILSYINYLEQEVKNLKIGEWLIADTDPSSLDDILRQMLQSIRDKIYYGKSKRKYLISITKFQDE